MTFQHIENWIFDLDDTLYPPSSGYVPQMYGVIIDYLKKKNDLSDADFEDLRKHFSTKYKRDWLEGFVTELDFDMQEWIDAVMTLDHTKVPVCELTQGLLAKLPGRKFVLTNGPRAHAERLLHHLNLFGHFEEVNAICQRDGKGKSVGSVMADFAAARDLDPKTCCMVEDQVYNLISPHELGMTTVLVYGDSAEESVHHCFKDLISFLELANE